MTMTTTVNYRRLLVTLTVVLWISVCLQSTADGACIPNTPVQEPDPLPENIHYAAVIDAGSSGSRIRVYRWEVDKNNGNFDLPEFQEVHCSNTKTGVSACQTNAEIETHVLGLLQPAIRYVPEALRSKSPIYFMATAGMRMMLEDKANNATAFIKSLLANKAVNSLQFHEENIRVLSGEEEGIFSWIAANYLDGVFKEHGVPGVTHGILELGGASTQIAFEHKKNILANQLNVQVGGVLYRLYVHSYLNYGQEMVDKWIMDRIYNNQSIPRAGGTLPNPCILIGDKSIGINNTITFVGTGNPEECTQLLNEMLYKPTYPWRCNPKPCGIGTTYQPTINRDQHFFVVGSFRYPLQGLGGHLLGSNGSFSIKEMTQAAFNFCRTPFETIKTQRAKDGRFLSRECLTGLYMPILFTKAYGFHAETRQILTPVRLGTDSIEWTLGAVIHEFERQRCQPSCLQILRQPCPVTTARASLPTHATTLHNRLVSLICGLLVIAVGSYATVH